MPQTGYTGSKGYPNRAIGNLHPLPRELLTVTYLRPQGFPCERNNEKAARRRLSQRLTIQTGTGVPCEKNQKLWRTPAA